MWLFYGLGGVFAVSCVVGAYRERRRFRNAILLGAAVVCLALGLLGELSKLDPAPLEVGVVLLFVAMLLSVVVLAGFLIANGVTMVRREGRRPANLLSLLAGIGCVVVLAMPILALRFEGNRVLGAVTIALLFLTVYVAFLFCSFLIYATVYGRLPARSGADFVLVLGAGLIRGKITPLLAGRLDQALAVRERQSSTGAAPILVTSGGRGADEPVAEAEAMADYLLGRGISEEAVLREDRSRSTLENLMFSDRIMAARVPGYHCVVVTNDFHVFRTALLARRAGLNGQVRGAPTARYFWPSATIREFVAIVAGHPILNGAIALILLILGALIGAER
ncbi:YdcF family protein [Pseudonocardia nematodicida]|uniref:YdcF family protein n=1 Tax=Pseudonocardia nematodicida TaxID=1206997 RepID=A0ABV1KBG7_9PSEU